MSPLPRDAEDAVRSTASDTAQVPRAPEGLLAADRAATPDPSPRAVRRVDADEAIAGLGDPRPAYGQVARLGNSDGPEEGRGSSADRDDPDEVPLAPRADPRAPSRVAPSLRDASGPSFEVGARAPAGGTGAPIKGAASAATASTVLAPSPRPLAAPQSSSAGASASTGAPLAPPSRPAPAVSNLGAASSASVGGAAAVATPTAVTAETAPPTTDRRVSSASAELAREHGAESIDSDAFAEYLSSLPGVQWGTVVPLFEEQSELTATPFGELPAYAHQYDIHNDITGISTCEGAISDFTRYFGDRLRRIRRLFKQRREMVGAIPIKAIRNDVPEVRFIAIVSEVRATKNGHRLLEVEDETGNAVVLALNSDDRVMEFAESVIEDEVVGIIAKPSRKGDLLILQNIIRPDISFGKTPHRGNNPASVAFISDLHMGARSFLSDDWERFVSWISGKHPDRDRRLLAERTKYVVVAGDIVDGIGIFPGQEDELAIVDGYDQYAFAGEQFQRILDARPDLRIIMQPGNHDLVRPAEPQPALPEKYRKLMPAEIRQVGNPCRIVIEGVEVLAYHGRGFDDWIMRVQGLSYERPVDAMVEMLKRRHVLPMYGLRTPVAPEHRDYLVIDQVPDIFVTGHVHAVGMQQYRGVSLINSSCWQSQTSYQKMHGFNPDPSKVPVVDLDSGRGWLLDFHRGSAGVDRFGRGPTSRAIRQHEAKNPPGSLSF